jgi:hypothetical protein
LTILISFFIIIIELNHTAGSNRKCTRGHSSVVERNLAKVDVARSNRVARLLQ